MNLSLKPNWMSMNDQDWIEPPSVPLTSPEEVQERACDIIKVKMIYNPVPVVSEIYEFQMTIFDNKKPKELLKIQKTFNTSIEGTGTTPVAGIVNFLSMLIHEK